MNKEKRVDGRERCVLYVYDRQGHILYAVPRTHTQATNSNVLSLIDCKEWGGLWAPSIGLERPTYCRIHAGGGLLHTGSQAEI